jgi:hypothetical protein
MLIDREKMLGKNSYHARTQSKSTFLRSECLKKSIVFDEDINYDETLFVNFRDDYDITQLHQKVIGKINHDATSSSFLESKIKRIKTQIENARTRFDQTQLLVTLRLTEKEYESVSDPNRLSDFINKTQPLLQEYARIRKSSRVCVSYLPSSKEVLYNPTPQDLERIKCIVSYLDIAKQYYKIEYCCSGYFKELPWYACESCEEDLSKCTMDKFGMVVCPCCFEQKLLRNICDNHDGSDCGGVAPKKNNSNNIVKAFYEFQGKILPKTDYELMGRELDVYFQSIGFPPAEKIRSMKCLPNGKKPGTSMLFMRNGIVALSKQQGRPYQKFYNAARFMCHYLWGWILEDLSSIEASILNDDQILKEGYDEIPYSVKQRTSSIPVQVRLYFHLKRYNVSCEQEDFKLPKEINKYNELLQLACENADNVLVYTPI